MSYFDNTGRDDVVAGGVKRIPIKTPKGTFNVWTKRVGKQVPAESEGARHLQHDDEYPGVQRLREQGADTADGSESGCRDQEARSGEEV
jgi:hypothetical protein